MNRLKWARFSVVICLVISVLTIQVLATSTSKVATLVYNDIKISLNGNSVTLKDANGNPMEPFSIDGTTYLPVRAVGNALGVGVNWNGSTNTVQLTGATLPEASDVIYALTTPLNEHSGDLLSVTAEEISHGSVLDNNYVIIQSALGKLALYDELGETSWANLVDGRTYTFIFQYMGYSDDLKCGTGIYLGTTN